MYQYYRPQYLEPARLKLSTFKGCFKCGFSRERLMIGLFFRVVRSTEKATKRVDLTKVIYVGWRVFCNTLWLSPCKRHDFFLGQKGMHMSSFEDLQGTWTSECYRPQFTSSLQWLLNLEGFPPHDPQSLPSLPGGWHHQNSATSICSQNAERETQYIRCFPIK